MFQGFSHKTFWAVQFVMILFLSLVLIPQPARSEVQVVPQTMRVCIAQKVIDTSFKIQGKYRLVDNSTGAVIGLPREGEIWKIHSSGNRMEVSADNKVIGNFTGPVSLEAIEHRVNIMSGNGSLVQKGNAMELAIQSAEGTAKYTEKELSNLWALGKNKNAPLKTSSGLSLVDINVGQDKPFNTYRGEFEFRRTGDSLLVINQLGIEEYLYGVVSAEMHSWFPVEAIKAQAVASRSYLIASFGNYSSQGFDILATQNSQVYKGYSSENNAAIKAVNDTRGDVMVFRGRPIPAFFHSSSGGYTENSEDIWSSVLPYMRTQPDPFDRSSENDHYNWQVSYSQQELINQLMKMGYKFREVNDVKVKEMTASGKRVKIIAIIGKGEDGTPKYLEVGNANNARNAFNLKSAMFELEKDIDANERLIGLTFTGHGWGHGLGLSQWGARGMAEQGYNYREILQYYYTGVSIVNNYGL